MPLKLPPINKIWLILLGLLVIGLISMRFPISQNNQAESAFLAEGGTDATLPKPNSEQWSMKDYEEFYETSMKAILEQILGVGEVVVMVNLDSTEEKIYQTNVRTGAQVTEEKDHQGGNRRIDDATRDEAVVTISNGNGETPVIVKTLKPTIRGVVVVAEGAENPKVKSWIFDVIQRSLDVPIHRISVVPKKIN